MEDIVILDVGARGGFHPRWQRLAGRLHAIAFDADANAPVDRPNAKRYELFRTALWKEAGEQTLHLTRSPGCSSFFKPNMEFIQRFTNPTRYDVMATRPVRTQRLDTLERRPHFIKLDTQGAELGILEGAAGLLDGVIGLEVEVEFAPVYLGAPLFGDVDRFLRAQGFELCDLNKVYWRDRQDQRMRCINADALYFARPDRAVNAEIAQAIAACYAITLRQSLAHAFQWIGRWVSSRHPYDADMQVGH